MFNTVCSYEQKQVIHSAFIATVERLCSNLNYLYSENTMHMHEI